MLPSQMEPFTCRDLNTATTTQCNPTRRRGGVPAWQMEMGPPDMMSASKGEGGHEKVDARNGGCVNCIL